MDQIEYFIERFSSIAWGMPLVILLIGGGLYLILLSRGLPYLYFMEAWSILKNQQATDDDTESISPIAALSTALSSTIGMGNIAGVAVAISIGGPGAIFWMWVSGLIGMITKFFTCSLAIRYKGKDDRGIVQGGPMYIIESGLGPKWKPLAIFFAVAGTVGALPVFNANQLTAAIQKIILDPIIGTNNASITWVIGIILVILTAIVSIGGITSVSRIAERIVPVMVVVYFLAVFGILLIHWDQVLGAIQLIFSEAVNPQYYRGDPIFGGVLGGLIVHGIRRGAFSNEAGIGTAPLAHGASKQTIAAKEGLTAMLGPFIDTIIVCTLTALSIIVTGVWQDSQDSGVVLTLQAFNNSMGQIGGYILMLCIFFFSMSSLFSFSYYGVKCTRYLFGYKAGQRYLYIYLLSILLGAVTTLDMMINLIDGFYALMAIPTMITTLLLSKKIWKHTKEELLALKD